MSNPSEKAEELDEIEERDCLELGSGESKLNTDLRSKWQLLANMVKAAADMAYTAVRSGILFKKIVTYGLLVDCKS